VYITSKKEPTMLLKKVKIFSLITAIDFVKILCLTNIFTTYSFFYYYYSYVHTRLGSFLSPAPAPSLTTHSAPSLFPLPPQYPAETILPLFLILL
jgi:hypothetical protein